MKKIFFSLAVACVAVVAGNQSFAQTKARFGITAGVNFTTLGSATSGGVTLNYDYRPGFQGGIFAEVPLNQSVTFEPHLLYSQKGGNINTTISGVTVKGHTQLNYLDIPLLFDFNLKSGVSFFVGPQIAVLMSQSTSATASFGGATSSNSSTSTDGIRKTVFGANFGVGYNVNSNIGLKLHYLLDLQNAGDGSNGVADTGEKNSGFALTAGFRF